MTCRDFLIDPLWRIHDRASPKFDRVMLAMTFIISDVVSYAKSGDFGRFPLLECAGLYRWQTSTQASIPWRINSARPKLGSTKRSCLFNTCERSDSYCRTALLSDSITVGEYLNVIFSFFFFASRHVLSFSGEPLCQIFPLSMAPVSGHQAVFLLLVSLR